MPSNRHGEGTETLPAQLPAWAEAYSQSERSGWRAAAIDRRSQRCRCSRGAANVAGRVGAVGRSKLRWVAREVSGAYGREPVGG